MLPLESMKYNEIMQCLTVSQQYLIISVSDINGIILGVSDAFCKISGYTKEELIGQPHNIVRHPDSSSEMFKELWQTIQSGKQWQGEIKNRKKDGSYYWVVTTIFPRVNTDGEIIGYFSLRQDITAIKDLLEQEAKMKEHEKSAAMGEMVGMIAHEWMQPISTISAANSNLEFNMGMGTLKDEDLQYITTTIKSSIDYISETIDNFRNFFKKDAQHIETSLIDLIEYAASICRPLIKKNFIQMNLHYIGDDPQSKTWMIHTLSRNDFAHIIINLIKNAADELINRSVENPTIDIRAQATKDTVIIKISDNAGGIPENALPHIFDKGFTNKGEQGTGLGLYMTKLIIEQHFQGHIHVANKDNGACFTITLPKRLSLQSEQVAD